MGETSNIGWTDGTGNPWEGCQKVGPGCDHCYAETRNIRFSGGENWGPGAPRRKTKGFWKDLPRLNKQADKFYKEHGRRRRIFVGSLCDIMDNAVPMAWSFDALRLIEKCSNINFQLLTKRVGNISKQMPVFWRINWPQHVGLMITVVNQEEADRDIPKLLKLKSDYGVPWIGVSYEPALGPIDFTKISTMHFSGAEIVNSLDGQLFDFLDVPIGAETKALDWVICGGESGPNARFFEQSWASKTIAQCDKAGVPLFMKQAGSNPVGPSFKYIKHHKGENPSEWPGWMNVQEFPEALI